MTTIKILSVEKNDNLISVFKEITDDEGNVSINQHMFTEDTVEWRAAEYGIRDMDKVIDIILYEPFTTTEEFGSIYDFESREKALEAHSKIITDKKEAMRKLAVTNPVGTKLTGAAKSLANKLDENDNQAHEIFYDQIKEACLFDEENLAIKTEHILSVFEAKSEEAKTKNTKRETPRGERLRSLLTQPGKSEA